MTRPVALVFTRYYLPGWKAGGPIRSISNIVRELHGEIDFRITTSDRDHTDSVAFNDVRVNDWNEVSNARVFYAAPRRQHAYAIGNIITEVDPDVVYLNTFFSPVFAVAPLWRRRFGGIGKRARWIIAPRGEFSPGAMAFKPWRKRAFIPLAGISGLLDRITWQATSEQEAEDIGRETNARDSHIVLAGNITDGVADLAAIALPAGPLRVCFISRVSPKKNLSFAVEALTRVQRPVEFAIYGPVEDEAHVAACNRIAASAGDRLTIHWHGPVPHEDVRSIFAQHDLFLFPTLGENFGHVIFESLAAGTPVLVSDRTPWQDLEPHGVGWVRSLDRIQDFVDVIDAVAMMPAEERRAMRYRANDYARTVHRQSPAVEQTRRLLLGGAHS